MARTKQKQLVVGGKEITIYPADTPDSPVIYFHVGMGKGEQEYWAVRQICNRDFTLAVIGNLDWNHDMAPWDIPPIAKGDTPCTGGADDYLRLLTNKIVPEVERQTQGTAAWRGLAGYSLAGLFAVYASYKSELFSRIGSMSGSLWFPGFQEYVFSQQRKWQPEYIYFSLGDKECRTGNPFLKVVQEHTEAIQNFYRESGIRTTLQLHPGGHFQNVTQRTAAGIAWLLNE